LISRVLNVADLQGSSKTKVESGTPAALNENSTTVEMEATWKRKNLNLRQSWRRREQAKLRFKVNHKIKHLEERKWHLAAHICD